MGSTKSTAGSANAARSPRSVTRESRTATLMENIMTGGEVSKKREAELQKAANYGRGVKFVEASPTVKGLTQKGGKPVYRTGVTAQDFTGRITANEPTLRELGGDIVRGLVGGQAPDPGFTGEYSKYTPKPEAVKGTGFFQFGDSGNDSKQTTTTTQPTEEFAESEAEAERKKKLAGSLISLATKGRSLFQIKGRTISGGMA